MADADHFRDLCRDMDLSSYTVGSSHLVNVVYIQSPNSFYVRPVSIHIELIEVYGQPITWQDLTVGKRLIFYSTTLKKFVRGDIESINFDDERSTCIMNIIDYGVVENDVLLEYMYFPKIEWITKCPPLALHCELYLCCPRGGDSFSQEAIDTMKLLVGEHAVGMIIRCRINDKFTVDLRSVECPDNISTMLAYMGYTAMLSSTPAVDRLHACIPQLQTTNILKYKSKPVKIGDRFHVKVQTGGKASSFYVATADDYINYMNDRSYFTVYCKRQPMANAKRAAEYGLACGIEYDTKLFCERVIVKNIEEGTDRCIVWLIDWGCEMVVPINCVRIVQSEKFTKRPAIAFHCATIQDQLHTLLYKGFNYDIEIVQVGDDKSPHIVKVASV